MLNTSGTSGTWRKKQFISESLLKIPDFTKGVNAHAAAIVEFC